MALRCLSVCQILLLYQWLSYQADGKRHPTAPFPILSLVSVCAVQGPRHLALVDSVPTTMAKDTFSKGTWLLGPKAGPSTKDGHIP